MEFENCKYYSDPRNGERIGISFNLVGSDESHSVLLGSTDNRHYVEIMRQVEAGDLTILDPGWGD